MLKFEAYKKALCCVLQKVTTSSYFSNQPVVPETTGIFCSKAALMLETAASGTLKLIATSASEREPSSCSLSRIYTIL